MKRPTIFRTVVVLSGLCVSLWQAPQLVEMVQKMRNGLSPAAAVAGLTGRGKSPPDENGVSLEQLRSALSGAAAGKATPDETGSMLLISPGAAKLTPEQLAELQRQAHRLRPDQTPGAPGGRVSLPPGAARPTKQSATPNATPRPPQEQGEHSNDGSHADADDASGGRGPRAVGSDFADGALALDGEDDLADEFLIDHGREWEPIGIHDELRELLADIAPPTANAAERHARSQRFAWHGAALPRNPRPAFIIGPAGSAGDGND